jgi:hypothetical protein
MTKRAWFAGSVIALAASNCIAQDQIETRATGENAYELILRGSTVTDVEAGQRQISSKASSLCKDKPVRFGRYEFSLDERISGSAVSEKPLFILKQQIRCGVEVEGQSSVVPPI